MAAQINSQAVKLLDVADDPRLSRGTKEFLKALNSTGVALEKLTPIEARQVSWMDRLLFQAQRLATRT